MTPVGPQGRTRGKCGMLTILRTYDFLSSPKYIQKLQKQYPKGGGGGADGKFDWLYIDSLYMVSYDLPRPSKPVKAII